MRKFTYFLLLVNSLFAAQEQPWIDQVFLPVAHLSTTFQRFNRLASDHGNCHYPGRGLFLNGGVLFATSPELQGEVEVCLSATHHHNFAFDHLKQTAKYAFFDDAQGDPLSLAVGISLKENWSRAVHDISVIAHSNMEGELHLALGKEWSQGAYWCHRLWGLAALGVGERGSPWLRGLIRSSHNFEQTWILSLQAQGEMGLGGNSLRNCHFEGYGSIAYRYLDLSVLGAYVTCSGLIIQLELLQRAYSRNAPKALHHICFGLVYPFNL